MVQEFERSSTFDTSSIPTKILSTAGRRVLAEYEEVYGPKAPIFGPRGMAKHLALEGFESSSSAYDENAKPQHRREK